MPINLSVSQQNLPRGPRAIDLPSLLTIIHFSQSLLSHILKLQCSQWCQPPNFFSELLVISTTESLKCNVCRPVLVVAALAAALAAATVAVATQPPTNYIVLNSLEDGEFETRIRTGDITAKEVTVGSG